MRFLRMLWKCVFVWEVQPASDVELRQVQAIFAFANSRMRDGSPGEGNERIAITAFGLQKRYSLAVLAQDEVELAARSLGLGLTFTYIARGPQHGKSTLRWNTAAITDEFLSACMGDRWTRVAIATRPEHMARCIWIAERRGLEVIAAEMPRGRWSHPDLALWACRGGTLRFLVREFAARVLCLIQGEM